MLNNLSKRDRGTIFIVGLVLFIGLLGKVAFWIQGSFSPTPTKDRDEKRIASIREVNKILPKLITPNLRADSVTYENNVINMKVTLINVDDNVDLKHAASEVLKLQKPSSNNLGVCANENIKKLLGMDLSIKYSFYSLTQKPVTEMVVNPSDCQ